MVSSPFLGVAIDIDVRQWWQNLHLNNAALGEFQTKLNFTVNSTTTRALSRQSGCKQVDLTTIAGTTNDETSIAGTTNDKTSVAGTTIDETTMAGTTNDETTMAGTTNDENTMVGTTSDETTIAGTTNDGTTLDLDCSQSIITNCAEFVTKSELLVSLVSDSPHSYSIYILAQVQFICQL